MDILVLGGSFDPPHLGHLALLKEAIRYRRPKLVLAVPSFQTPLKGPACASPSQRLRMLKLLLSELPPTFRRLVRVDLFELRRRRKTYTYELLKDIRRRHPKAALHLAGGTDMLKNLRHWRRWEWIARNARLLVGKRSGFLTGIDSGGLELDWLPGLFPSISSTEVRRRIAAGEDASDEVPEAVLRFADRGGLYGRDVHRWLRSRLAKERYAHTLSVTRLADDLAGAWRLDVDRARTAALLHDAGRCMRPAALVQYVRRRRLKVPLGPLVARKAPLLLHPYVSADLARRRFGVRDAEVLGAIAKHTLGGPGLRPLEKVMYVADVASEDRNFPEAGAIRKLAYEDLDAALREAVRVKLAYVLASGGWLHPAGVQLWNEILTRG